MFVNSGGATIDTQGFDAGFTNNLFDGGGGLTKNGTGTLTLNNVANSYAGATVVNAGTLVFKSDTITSSISVSSNATVVYDSLVVRNVVGISGAGNAEFKGVQDGFYSLATSLTHSGTTTINMTPGSEAFYGTLFVQSANKLSANSVLNVLSGKVNLRADQTIAGLSGSGGYVTTDDDSAAASVLTINTATGQTHSYSGVVGTTPDAYNNSTISITKTGEGTQVLSGNNTYTGYTTVSDGTLALSGGSAILDSGILVINSPSVVNLTGNETVGQLFFGDLQLAAGNYTNSSHPSYFTGSGMLIVENGPVGDYATWANDNVEGQAANLDFDGDGLGNGVEFFMGTDGAAFTANPQLVAGVITWARASGTIIGSFMVEVSSNLVDWTDASATYPGSVDTTSDLNEVVFTTPTGEDKLFVRLSVTP